MDWLDDPKVNSQTYFERAGTWGLATRPYAPRNLSAFKARAEAATDAVQAAHADAMEEADEVEDLWTDYARAVEDEFNTAMTLDRKEKENESIQALRATVQLCTVCKVF